MSRIYQKKPDGSFRLLDGLWPDCTVLAPADSETMKTVFYVSPDGNDENDGQSVNTPFEHIGRALDTAQRSLGKLEIRLAQQSSGNLDTLYRLTDPVMREFLASDLMDHAMKSWDFATDSAASRNVGICPPTGETRAYIDFTCQFHRISFVGSDYGENGEPLGDNSGRNAAWTVRRNCAFINCSMVSPIIHACSLSFRGNFYCTSDSLNIATAALTLDNMGNAWFYRDETGAGAVGIHPRNVRSGIFLRQASILDLNSANIAASGNGSAAKKIIAYGKSLATLGANINALPGTGAEIDATSILV